MDDEMEEGRREKKSGRKVDGGVEEKGKGKYDGVKDKWMEGWMELKKVDIVEWKASRRKGGLRDGKRI